MKALLLIAVLAAEPIAPATPAPSTPPAPAALATPSAPAAGVDPATAPVPASAPAPASPSEIDIRSETLVIRHADRQATFGGGVTAVRGDLTMRCPEVLALYDAAAKVKTVRCLGPITAIEAGRTMNAGSGEFDNTTGVLTLAGEPTLVEGERRLTGDLLTYDVATRKAELRQARAQFPSQDAPSTAKVAGRGPMLIAADRVVYDTQGRVATFRGGVVATRGDLTVHAPRLVTRLDEHGRIVSGVTGGGPVTVTQRDRRGTAQKATFTGGTNRLVLEGEPTVVERESTLAGETITFLLAEDRVEVQRPRASFPLREATGGRR